MTQDPTPPGSNPAHAPEGPQDLRDAGRRAAAEGQPRDPDKPEAWLLGYDAYTPDAPA